MYDFTECKIYQGTDYGSNVNGKTAYYFRFHTLFNVDRVYVLFYHNPSSVWDVGAIKHYRDMYHICETSTNR